ncbi:ComF family protein [Streptococcus himalayensis]|uniref:Competence protein n=1 Tax=Streptococcus himalayensis TaxID=1888195 RepID=A0A917A5P1_9STRE|nr:ComF family protein [Streptococcus himalayensis]GGE28872.1 competence protein [Streptococcus himalayensis]
MNHCLLCHHPLKQHYRFLDLLLLKKQAVFTCDTCMSEFKEIGEQHCERCWKEGEDVLCSDCQEWEKKGEMIEHQACFRYNQAMKEYFSTYKFQGDYALHRVFARTFSRALKPYQKEFTLVPIPVSSHRFQKRGFNQVTAFLEGAKLSYSDLLEKEDSLAQSSKTREERLQTQQVFSIRDLKNLPEKILLIDDIYTTGATLHLAKKLLLENGVKRVRTFSLAR